MTSVENGKISGKDLMEIVFMELLEIKLMFDACLLFCAAITVIAYSRDQEWYSVIVSDFVPVCCS